MYNKCVPPSDRRCALDHKEAFFYDTILANATITHLDAAQRRSADDCRPWMVMAGFVRPHAPFLVPTRAWRRYNISRDVPTPRSLSFRDAEGVPPIALAISTGGLWPPYRRGSEGEWLPGTSTALPDDYRAGYSSHLSGRPERSFVQHMR